MTTSLAAELAGAEGEITWFDLADNAWLCEAFFHAAEPDCGVRFACEPGHLAYCPCGLEASPVAISAGASARPLRLFLPNGFLSLSDSLHLLRLNASAPVPARLDREQSWAVFLAKGMPEGKLERWRFQLLRGPRATALAAANRLNQAAPPD
ncbi:MAG: hypothetical protein ACREFQ_16310 [Stellaceae bacterium]